MKLFQSIEKSLTMLGVHPPKENRNSTFNSKNTTVLCLVATEVFLGTCYLFEAKSFREMGDCFYLCVTDSGNFIYLYSIISNTPGIFEQFNELNEFIQRSVSFVGLFNLFNLFIIYFRGVKKRFARLIWKKEVTIIRPFFDQSSHSQSLDRTNVLSLTPSKIANFLPKFVTVKFVNNLENNFNRNGESNFKDDLC